MTAQELKLDYFKIYDVKNLKAGAPVRLQGQFEREPDSGQLLVLDYFANAVSKNGEPVYNRHAHLIWYRLLLRAPQPVRVVVAQDQFGKHEFQTRNVIGLLAPAQKAERGSEFPKTLDHFKVYWALSRKPVVRKVKLEDQFGKETVELTGPLCFAVPIRKWHGGRAQTVHNPRVHLLIYAITSRETPRRIGARDQFGAYRLAVVRSFALAVPSLKLKWKRL